MRSGSSAQLGGWRSAQAGAGMSSGRSLVAHVCPALELINVRSIDTGIPGYNGQKHMGCYPYWNGQDLWGIRNNAAVNAIFFTGSGAERRLHVPSLGLIMQRA